MRKSMDKQYILVVDEIGMAFLSKVMPNIRYIEVMGMHVAGCDDNQFLVSPVPKVEPHEAA
jgi:hypothetical protein